jgi:hypothetical protein
VDALRTSAWFRRVPFAGLQRPGGLRAPHPTADSPRALLGSRYSHGKLHVVVVTKTEKDRSPHPAMPI